MINDSIDNFRLEINKPSMRGAFYVRKGDTRARTIHVTLSNNGKVIDLSRAKVCELLIKKEDGNQCDQAMVRVGNELQYTLRTQDINVAGENHCWIMVTFDDGAVLTAPEFSIFVYEKEVDQNLEKSTNEYTNLSAMYIDVLKVDEDMRKFVNEQSEDISGLVNKAASSETNASNSAAASASSASQAQDSADAAKSYEDNCSSYTDTVSGLAANVSDMNAQTKDYMDSSESYRDECARYADNIRGIAATKADRLNPNTMGIFRHTGDIYATGDVYIKDSDGHDSPIMQSLEYMRDNILFPMRTGLIKAEQDIAQNTSDIANKANKVNPTTSGTFSHDGDMRVSNSLEVGGQLEAHGTYKEQEVMVDDVAGMLVGLEEDISGLKTNPVTSGSAVHHGNMIVNGELKVNNKLEAWGKYNNQKCYVDDVAGMLYSAADVVSAIRDGLIKADEDIESLKRKPSGITLTSASPLESSAAAGIAGLSAKGKSEQKTTYFEQGTLISDSSGKTFEQIKYDNAARIRFNDVCESTAGSTITVTVASGYEAMIKTFNGSKVFVATSDWGATVSISASEYYAVIIRKTSGANITPSEASNANLIVSGASSYTPTPANPIPIVDASGVIEAHNNSFDEFEEVGKFIDAAGNISSNVLTAYSKAISVTSGTTVTISYKKGGETNDRLHAYDAKGNWLRQIALISPTTDKIGSKIEYNFEVDNYAKYIRLSMGKDNTNICVATQTNEINLSSIGIDLRSVGNVKDELIVKPDGSGEWVRKVGVLRIGDTNWERIGSNTHCYDTPNVTDAMKQLESGLMATCYVSGTVSDSVIGVVATSGTGKIRVSDSITDIAQFKTARANEIIYYPLATPVVHTLTAEQVAAILALQTYAGTTIVESELDEVVVDYITDTKDYVDQRTSIENIVEKELRTLRWSKSIYIDTRSGGIREIMPSGLPYLENLKYKSMMISEYGEEISIEDMRVSFDLGVEKYMDIDWLLASSPESIGEGAVLTVLFYWEVSSTRVMPAVAMLSDVQPMMMSEVETDE